MKQSEINTGCNCYTVLIILIIVILMGICTRLKDLEQINPDTKPTVENNK